jgi:hypothetical protein
MSPDKAATAPAEPWRSFLRELDAYLTGQVELRCFGGFVVAQHYATERNGKPLLRIVATQDHRLIADQAGRSIHRMRVATLGFKVLHGAGDEEAASFV